MACRINSAIQFPADSLPFPVAMMKSSRQKLGVLVHSPSRSPQKISCSSRTRGYQFVVKSQTATESRPIADDRMLVFVPPHPLIKHWVSVLRDERTPCPIFRNAMAELGRLLIYEASRDWLPTVVGEIQSPMGIASVEFIDPREPVLVVPILRAGLALVEHASSILPATQTCHLGISRDETTLLPNIYLNKLPEKIPEGSRVLIVDPMLATGLRPFLIDAFSVVGIKNASNFSQDMSNPGGLFVKKMNLGGTIVAAVDLLKDRGVDNQQIKVISAVAASPALQKLSEKFPGLHVYTGIIDPAVNEKGFIIPGLGDAGDRTFGT